MRLIDKLQASALDIGATFDLESRHKNSYLYTCPHGTTWRTRLSSKGTLPSKQCPQCHADAENRRKSASYKSTQTAEYAAKCADAQIRRYSDPVARTAHSDAMLASNAFRVAVRSPERSVKISKSLKSSRTFAEATYKNEEWRRQQSTANAHAILRDATDDPSHCAHTTTAYVAIMRTSTGVYKVGKARDLDARYGGWVTVLHSRQTTEYTALRIEQEMLDLLRATNALNVSKDACGLRRGHGWTECFTDCKYINELINIMEK